MNSGVGGQAKVGDSWDGLARSESPQPVVRRVETWMGLLGMGNEPLFTSWGIWESAVSSPRGVQGGTCILSDLDGFYSCHVIGDYPARLQVGIVFPDPPAAMRMKMKVTRSAVEPEQRLVTVRYSVMHDT